MKMYELYKSFYEQEVAVRHFYDGKLLAVFTILSATAAALYHNTVRLLAFMENASLLYIGYGLTILSLGIFALQMVFTFLAFFSIKYKYMDFPVHWIKDRMIAHIQEAVPGEDDESQAISRINKMLVEYYEECATHWYLANLKKRKAHHILNALSYFNFMIIILLYVLWLI